jgi:hypothetical protein
MTGSRQALDEAYFLAAAVVRAGGYYAQHGGKLMETCERLFERLRRREVEAAR